MIWATVSTQSRFCWLYRASPFLAAAAAAAKSLQSCPTLCNPRDSSPLGSSVPGILQARILEWVAISFSNAWKWKVKVKSLSHGRLLATPWSGAYQAPPSIGFSRQEYWSGVPLPGYKKYNQSDFSIDHLVSSMCRVFSDVVGRGCLLWPVHSLGKTLLAFVLLHLYSKAKFACYSRCFLISYFCILVPYNEKDIFFGC